MISTFSAMTVPMSMSEREVFVERLAELTMWMTFRVARRVEVGVICRRGDISEGMLDNALGWFTLSGHCSV
ncbi:MAG: hypothetical protein ACP5O0_09545 [Acidimicrobiales bacterium]